jgi:predicted dinucleotide-binding enzyme
VFIAGDDQAAKARVSDLASSGALRPIDAGALKRARELAAAAMLQMEIQTRRQTGFTSALKVIP